MSIFTTLMFSLSISLLSLAVIVLTRRVRRLEGRVRHIQMLERMYMYERMSDFLPH